MRNFLLCTLFFFVALTSHAKAPDLNLYLRVNSNQNAAPMDAINGLYDFDLSRVFRAQAGMRFGETEGLLSQWNYKFEVSTIRFFKYLSLLSRFTKANTFYPGDNLKTIFMNLATFTFPLGNFSFVGTLGETLTFSSKGTSVFLPSFSGTSDWTPSYLVGVSLKNPALSEVYKFKFANFDVFDVYATNTPYLQLELEQEFKTLSAYIYGRYRYQDDISNFYKFYLAVGVIIPFSGEKEHPEIEQVHHPIKDN